MAEFHNYDFDLCDRAFQFYNLIKTFATNAANRLPENLAYIFDMPVENLTGLSMGENFVQGLIKYATAYSFRYIRWFPTELKTDVSDAMLSEIYREHNKWSTVHNMHTIEEKMQHFDCIEKMGYALTYQGWVLVNQVDLVDMMPLLKNNYYNLTKLIGYHALPEELKQLFGSISPNEFINCYAV